MNDLGMRPRRSKIITMLRLAADTCCTALWICFLTYIHRGYFRTVADPTVMSEGEIVALGPNAYGALMFMATFGDDGVLWRAVEQYRGQGQWCTASGLWRVMLTLSGNGLHSAHHVERAAPVLGLDAVEQSIRRFARSWLSLGRDGRVGVAKLVVCNEKKHSKSAVRRH